MHRTRTAPRHPFLRASGTISAPRPLIGLSRPTDNPAFRRSFNGWRLAIPPRDSHALSPGRFRAPRWHFPEKDRPPSSNRLRVPSGGVSCSVVTAQPFNPLLGPPWRIQKCRFYGSALFCGITRTKLRIFLFRLLFLLLNTPLIISCLLLTGPCDENQINMGIEARRNRTRNTRKVLMRLIFPSFLHAMRAPYASSHRLYEGYSFWGAILNSPYTAVPALGLYPDYSFSSFSNPPAISPDEKRGIFSYNGPALFFRFQSRTHLLLPLPRRGREPAICGRAMVSASYRMRNAPVNPLIYR